jgi:2-polyprenyl-3-methyl-5-hydroxy-6-metoxy-1,4-benzoquinol methylase
MKSTPTGSQTVVAKFPTHTPSATRCSLCEASLGPASLSSPDRMCGTPGTFEVSVCMSCGLGVTLPKVEPDELAAFYPRTYGAYGPMLTGMAGRLSTVVQDLLFWRMLHTMPLEHLSTVPAGRLLEIGCGRGDFGSQLVKRGWLAVGVEPSREACVVARQRGVEARVGTLDTLELEPETYDVAVFRQSLEHVLDPVGDLRRAYAALRPGGMVIISVPNFGCWQRRLFGGHWLHLDLPRHRHHFNEYTLSAALERAGFAGVQTYATYCNPGLPASIQYALFGRCLFPGGWRLRIAMAACALMGPLVWTLDRLVGGGDLLHAVAYKQLDA